MMDSAWNEYNNLLVIFDKLSAKILSYIHNIGMSRFQEFEP